MYRRKNQKLIRIVAFLVAAAMLVMTGFYIFAMTGWFSGSLEQGGFVARAASADPNEEERLEELEAFIREIRRNYKDEISTEVLFDGIYEGIFDALDDPWSVYYPSRETAERLIESITGDYSGVGITMTESAGRVLITTVVEDGPADRSGVKSGDTIVKVDGIDTAAMPLEDVSLLVRGEEGTTVTLTVERAGAFKVFTMEREMIRTASVFYEMREDGIGYIRISSFDSNTDNEFTLARLTLLNKGARSLIIDVRNNGGGLMAPALTIADRLVPFAGTLAHYERQGKILETVSSSVNYTKKVPLAVLVNENTASAAECFAGALQDNHVAQIIGRTTYGKGVAQTISATADGAAYKLSIFYFLTPNRRRIDGVGIVPDQIVHGSAGLSEEEIVQLRGTLAPMGENVKYFAGQMGLNVYGAQQRLRYVGYEAPLSGIMDEATLEAVKKFQADEKLYPYGGLDFTTMKALATAFEAYLFGGDEDLQLEAAVNWLNQ